MKNFKDYITKIHKHIVNNGLKYNDLKLIINVGSKKLLINNKTYGTFHRTSDLDFFELINYFVKTNLFKEVKTEGNIDLLKTFTDIQINNKIYKIIEYCKLNKINFYTGAEVITKNKRSKGGRCLNISNKRAITHYVL